MLWVEGGGGVNDRAVNVLIFRDVAIIQREGLPFVD